MMRLKILILLFAFLLIRNFPLIANVEGAGLSQGNAITPIAINDTLLVEYGKIATLYVLENDYDPDSLIDTSSLRIVIGANTGLFEIDTVNGFITYDQLEGYSSPDSMLYSICDIYGNCSEAWIFLTFFIDVNYKPQPEDDYFDVQWGEKEFLDVLANDVDRDDPLSWRNIEIIDFPNNGVAIIDSALNGVSYCPDTLFSGSDLFQYRVCDERVCSEATVYVNVLPKPNDLPMVVNDTVYISFNERVEIDPLLNDKDLDGFLDVNTLSCTVLPHNGTFTIKNGKIYYNPKDGFSGSDSLKYKICDDRNGCCEAWVFIDVYENRKPVLANDFAYIFFDSTSTVNVAENDYDIDGELDFSTLVLRIPPREGIIEINRKISAISYTPTEKFSCIDSLQYQLCDAYGACSTAWVFFEKDPDKSSYLVDDEVVIAQNIMSGIDFYSNDDHHFDLKTFEIIEFPKHGTIDLSYANNGSINYFPEFDFLGNDRITYQLQTVCGNVEAATIFIEVEDRIEPPELFTPNGDGDNDTYVIRELDKYPYSQFEVFNRWGNKVYEANNYYNQWDGHANVASSIGVDLLPVGTYYYVLHYGLDANLIKVKTGYVYILR